MTRTLIRVAAAGSVSVAAMMLSAGAFSSVAGAGGPVTITSVTFQGSATKPTITVKGSGFGKTAPTADPSAHPNGQANCPAFPTTPPKDIKHDGYDYGSNMLWLEDASRGWRAGDYVPPSETDCVGLRITQWSAHQITFKPGTAYDNPTLEAGNTYILASGDSVTIDVLGANSTTTY
jgi:hypothetical protein